MDDRTKQLDGYKQIESLVMSHKASSLPAFDYHRGGLTSDKVQDLEEQRLQTLERIKQIISTLR